MSAVADDWGLFVNEVGIFASGIQADRWLNFTLRAKECRLTMLNSGPQGGTWHVMYGTRAEADEARALFLEAGFHKSHVKAARLSACQAAEKRRHERVLAKMAEAGL